MARTTWPAVLNPKKISLPDSTRQTAENARKAAQVAAGRTGVTSGRSGAGRRFAP